MLLRHFFTYQPQIEPTLMKTKINQGLCVLALLFIGLATGSAQTLNKPTPADNPNLSGNSEWQNACASSNFNEYFVNFTWNPPLVASNNEFILELSDASGNFSSPVELARVADKNQVFDFDIEFQLPEDTQGEGYRLRVKSTNPEKVSEVSDSFAMYYIGYNSPILISKDGNGTIPPGGVIDLCDGESLTLATHNVSNANQYNYSWYRSGTALSGNSNSINITEPGIYYVEMNYGACSGSANTLSNSIEVNINAAQGVAINTPTKTVLCSEDTVTLTANVQNQGYTYTWYKDNQIIQAGTLEGYSFTVDAANAGFEGDYQVEIEGSGICVEKSDAVTISSAGSFTVALDNTNGIALLPGSTETITVTTDATSATYQWYKNGTAIAGATNPSYTITTVGDYYATVTETGGACTSVTKTTETVTAAYPAAMSIAIDYMSTYAPCENTNIELEVSSITATDANGNTTDVTESLKADFTYQWKKDGAAIAGATASLLSILNAEENGTYTLEANLESFNLVSNELSVVLNANDPITITADGNQICDGVIVTLSTDYDLNNVDFEWYKDGGKIAATTTSLTVTEAGNYQLKVLTNGCPTLSNEIVVNAFDESIVQLDKESSIVIPEGETTTVNATGADSYVWFNEANENLSTSSSVTLTEEGTYLLIATIGNCSVSKTVTLAFRDNFDIPNVVTANGDGVNDLWIIPNTYSRKANTRVIIYNENGEEIVNQLDYQNNWPNSTTGFTKKNQLFYYKIVEATKTLRQGTITVIR